MRTVRLTIWQMLMVVGIVLGVAIALLAGARVLVPNWQTPWLLPMLALVAADAVVTQRVVVRERFSAGEQWALRLVEAVLLTVVVRVASLAGEGGSLRAVLAPWLRDPLSFFNGRFSEYLLPAVVVWGLATLLAQSVLQFETELPRAGVRSQPNEEAAVLDDRAQALARFDQYWLLTLLVTLGGSALALWRTSLIDAVQTGTLAWPLLAVIIVLVSGLLLHSRGRFDQLNYGWQMEQITVETDVPRRWQRASRLLLLLALLLGIVLNKGVMLAPPLPLIPIINGLLVVLAFLLALIVALFGLILLPFAWLLSLLTGRPGPISPGIPNFQPPQITQATPERPLLPALIFWICVVLLVGLAAVRYVRQRQDLQTLLGRWRGTRWLMRWLSGVWHDVQTWSVLAVETISQRLRRRPRARRPRRIPPAGAQAQLRALYRRLVQSAQRRGVAHPRSQTPYEFRSALRQALPPADPDVAEITDVYVAAEYGPSPARTEDVRRVREHWRRIERLITGARRTDADRLRKRKR